MNDTARRWISPAAIVVILTATVAFAPASPAQDPKLAGQWTQPFWEGGAEPFDPPSLEKSSKYTTAATATVLPDGRVLYWNGLEGTENATFVAFDPDLNWTLENSRATILDLRSGKPRWTTPTLERGTTDEPQDSPTGATHDLFGSDQKLLSNGTVLIAGGMEPRHLDDIYGDDETRIFDPATDTFRSVQPMRERRWYPALITLPDGRLLVTSGVRQLGKSAANPELSWSQVRLNEVFDPATEEWEDAGVSDWSLPLYPRLHLLPDGKVFFGGAGQTWTPNGMTADAVIWGQQRVYDPATQEWSFGGPTLYGVRNGAASTLLRLEPPYDEAKILIAGGTAGVAPSTYAATTLSEVVRWTRDGGIENEALPKAPAAGLAGDATQLRNRRWYGSTVPLPTGEVLLVNGGDADDVLEPGSAAAVRPAEIYDPKTGTWQELAQGPRDRVYHNTAVLLPDGSVLTGGNSPVPVGRHDFPLTRSNNFKDPTFEIYKPPYLFRGPRPVVSSVTPVAGGRTLKLGIGGGRAAEISEVSLVRLGATTHAFEVDMRSVKLEHRAAGSNVFADLPRGGDGRILPPGPYYVFAMKDTPDGPTPSIAHTVMIQPSGDGTVMALSA